MAEESGWVEVGGTSALPSLPDGAWVVVVVVVVAAGAGARAAGRTGIETLVRRCAAPSNALWIGGVTDTDVA